MIARTIFATGAIICQAYAYIWMHLGVKVALAVEEEHAEILSAIIENLRNLNGALAG